MLKEIYMENKNEVYMCIDCLFIGTSNEFKSGDDIIYAICPKCGKQNTKERLLKCTLPSSREI